VRVRGELPPVALEGISQGELDDGRKLVVSEVAGSDEEQGGANRWYRIETVGASGKDVRRLVERQGALVSRVMRVSLGPLALTRDMNRGQFRALEEPEAAALGAAGGAAPRATARRTRGR
jgi:16S rRNA U516 pseudouridylate synthase RsuA-like enzyme